MEVHRQVGGEIRSRPTQVVNVAHEHHVDKGTYMLKEAGNWERPWRYVFYSTNANCGTRCGWAQLVSMRGQCA
jgi:hypothetical protein